MSTQTQPDESQSLAATREIGITRLQIGLAQGVGLYILYLANDARAWPATDGLVFAPLLIDMLFVPLILIQGVGNIRLKTLAIWAGAATVMLAALAYYDIWRHAPQDTPEILPSFGLLFFSIVALFIAHALVSGGDADRRFMAQYTTHFDVAWKQGVQLALSCVFVGIFWLVLWLGATLFKLIDLDFLERLIEHEWFWIPATTLAFAAALHVTDVRAGLVRGVRTLVLVLLSWLLPLMALIAAGFLMALVFTGLEPLWKTQHAAGILLTAAAALIILINATYQDGHVDRKAVKILHYAGTLAALLLFPIVGLAAYALELRVAQYGWTMPRVATAACIIAALSYALGYAFAALKPGPWLKLIERWNFGTALLVLVVIIAIFSPIADPVRISVTSQVARLQAGNVKVQEFDFNYLRWDGERFGREGLVELQKTAKGPEAAFIREKATAVLAGKSQYEKPAVLPEEREKQITVHSPDGRLPESFLKQDWSKASGSVPGCLLYPDNKCAAWVMDLNGDGKDEILVLDSMMFNGYQQGADGAWQYIGVWNAGTGCDKIREAVLAGQFKMVPPPPAPWPDMEVMGTNFRFVPPYMQPPSCPK
jgi:hypothetical protein